MAKNTRGGYRLGAGRPPKDNKYIISVRLTEANKKWLDEQPNKTQYINDLLEREISRRAT